MTAHSGITIRVNGSIPESDRTLILPEPVYLALEECAAKERRKLVQKLGKDALAVRLVTPLSLAQKVVRRYVEGERG